MPCCFFEPYQKGLNNQHRKPRHQHKAVKMMSIAESLEVGKLHGIGKMKANEGTNQDSDKEVADILI
jgi:hypothetical protein